MLKNLLLAVIGAISIGLFTWLIANKPAPSLPNSLCVKENNIIVCENSQEICTISEGSMTCEEK